MKLTMRAFCVLLALVLAIACFPSASSRAAAEAEETDWRFAAGDLLIGRMLDLTGDRMIRLGNPEDWLERMDQWAEALTEPADRVKLYKMPKAVDTHDRSDAGKIYFERLFMQNRILDLTTDHEDMEYYLTASMLAVNEGYVRPDGFEPCNLIYDYGTFCVVISFVEYGENVVMASGCICVPEIMEELTELTD